MRRSPLIVNKDYCHIEKTWTAVRHRLVTIKGSINSRDNFTYKPSVTPRWLPYKTTAHVDPKFQKSMFPQNAILPLEFKRGSFVFKLGYSDWYAINLIVGVRLSTIVPKPNATKNKRRWWMNTHLHRRLMRRQVRTMSVNIPPGSNKKKDTINIYIYLMMMSPTKEYHPQKVIVCGLLPTLTTWLDKTKVSHACDE